MNAEAQQGIERAVDLGVDRYSLEESILKLKGDRKFRRSKYRLRTGNKMNLFDLVHDA